MKEEVILQENHSIMFYGNVIFLEMKYSTELLTINLSSYSYIPQK